MALHSHTFGSHKFHWKRLGPPGQALLSQLGLDPAEQDRGISLILKNVRGTPPAEAFRGRASDDQVTTALAKDGPLVVGGAEGFLVMADTEPGLQRLVADAASEVRRVPGPIQGRDAIAEDTLSAG
jgi:hypothetical protein